MPDFGYAAAAMAAFDSLLEKAKLLVGISQRLKDSDITIAISDLNLALANANMELAKVVNDNARLMSELKKAQDIIRIRPNVIREDNHYKLTKPLEGYSEGPFCMRCFDVDGILVNLFHGSDRLICDECARHGIPQ